MFQLTSWFCVQDPADREGCGLAHRPPSYLSCGGGGQAQMRFRALAYIKGFIMDPRPRNARTTQTLRRIREPGPITALTVCRLEARLQFFRRRTLGPCGGRKEGPQRRKGSVNPLAFCRRGAITKTLQ